VPTFRITGEVSVDVVADNADEAAQIFRRWRDRLPRSARGQPEPAAKLYDARDGRFIGLLRRGASRCLSGTPEG